MGAFLSLSYSLGVYALFLATLLYLRDRHHRQCWRTLAAAG